MLHRSPRLASEAVGCDMQHASADGDGVIVLTALAVADAYMPQFHGRNPYFVIENLYQSVSFTNASMYRNTFHVIRIGLQKNPNTA